MNGPHHLTAIFHMSLINQMYFPKIDHLCWHQGIRGGLKFPGPVLLSKQTEAARAIIDLAEKLLRNNDSSHFRGFFVLFVWFIFRNKINHRNTKENISGRSQSLFHPSLLLWPFFRPSRFNTRFCCSKHGPFVYQKSERSEFSKVSSLRKIIDF